MENSYQVNNDSAMNEKVKLKQSFKSYNYQLNPFSIKNRKS